AGRRLAGQELQRPVVVDEKLVRPHRLHLVFREPDGGEKESAGQSRRELGALLLRLREKRRDRCGHRGSCSLAKISRRCPALANSATAKTRRSRGTSAGPVR